MSSHSITLCRDDYARLLDLLKDKLLGMIVNRGAVRDLAAELERAKLLQREALPSDVVAMNSIVDVTELRSGTSERYVLVYPEDANIAEGRLSVLAPIGTALLGYRVGDRVKFRTGSRRGELRIDAVRDCGEHDATTA